MRAILLAAFATLVTPDLASAQSYPTRPISLVVPASAGGTTDALARVIAKVMSLDLRQTVVVENVGGAGGTIGIMRVARAEPNGYTLLFGNMGQIAANASLYPKLNYDPRRAFEPIGLVADVPMVLSVSKVSGVRDLDSFVRKLRGKENTVNFGNAGPGSTGHLAAATFLHITKTKATLVPYRGAGPAINDLVAGVVDAVIDQTVTMIPMHNAGNVKAIAVSSKERLAQLPDVPTFAEGGVPEFDLTVWNAIATPKGTPPDVVERLEKSLATALNDPDVRRRFTDLAAEPPEFEKQGSEPLRTLISSDVDRLAQIIKDAGITAD
jgi:tripartite-type tricarboxylate transporter receptor subunit TctC